MKLKPFFSFYGSKWRAAHLYPQPERLTVIEPFAGGAGYACNHSERRVILVEKDPIIYSLWRWLIDVPASDVMQIPTDIQHVDELKTNQETKWLVGFWFNQGSSMPKRSRSKWMREKGAGWNDSLRERIAEQVELIRHWKVIHGDYHQAPDCPATWFIDPPYQLAGKYYRESSKKLDFAALGTWCQSRPGQTIVCENEGADWLPFRPFASIAAAASQGVAKRSEEVIWTRADESFEEVTLEQSA